MSKGRGYEFEPKGVLTAVVPKDFDLPRRSVKMALDVPEELEPKGKQHRNRPTALTLHKDQQEK